MANATTITLVNGIPTAPSGTVSSLDNLLGVAGTPNANVQSVQGVSGGTAVPVSLASVPSHAVTNAGTFAVQVTSAPTTAITAASLPLPAGAATATGVAAVVTALGTPLQAGGSVVITNANANISAIPGGTVAAGTAGAPVVGADQYGAYFPAAASATTLMGATGAVGDYLAGIVITPTVAAAGTVSFSDGNVTTEVFAGGGTTALPDLRPFFVPLGIFAKNATTPGFRLILGAGVTAVGVGKFT